jgi:hypothetical protein
VEFVDISSTPLKGFDRKDAVHLYRCMSHFLPDSADLPAKSVEFSSQSTIHELALILPTYRVN